MSGKNKKSSKYNTAAKRNLDTMKLLISWDKFKTDAEKIRKEFNMPSDGFESGKELEKWEESLCEESDKFIEAENYKDRVRWLAVLRKNDFRKSLSEQERFNSEVPINKFNKHIEDLIGKYSLPYNFLDAIKAYIYYDKIVNLYLPSANVSITINPGGRKNAAKWVGIKAYACLTKEEIKLAMDDLKNLQKHYLPEAITQDIKIKKDIDKAIEIEEEMNSRISKAIEKPNSYLENVRKQYGEKEYKRVKKLNPGMMTEIMKYTSSEIAKKVFGTRKKASLVRQIYARLQKERGKKFGKIVRQNP